jgi:hypothetical protein
MQRRTQQYVHPSNDDQERNNESRDLLTREVVVSTQPQLNEWVTLTIDEPTQMVIVSSILFFMAIQIEVTCSAALAY